MYVIQTVATIDNVSDGTSHFVLGLLEGLIKSKVHVELHSPSKNVEQKKSKLIVTYPRRTLFNLRGIEWSPEMCKGLKSACQTADVIHSNGLWMLPNIYPFFAIKGTNCKLVTQPHGTLSHWALNRSKWKKRLIGCVAQYAALRATDLWVATCEKEYREIRALGYKQPIAIIPIGLEIPTVSGQFGVRSSEVGVEKCSQTANLSDLSKPQNTEEYAPEHNVLGNTQKGAVASQLGVQSSQFAVGDNVLGTQNSAYAPVARPLEIFRTTMRLKRIVFFGRVHKVKAVDHLVKAWGALHADLPDWELVIAGPDCGAKGELEAIIAEQKIPRVRFVGEINGPAKYDFLTEADIYVLPSHTENFGVTVAEALACGTPSIASQGTPWEGLETEQCGKWVPIGVEPLITALRELTSLTDEERTEMGKRGRAWIQRDFSWDGIGAKMKAAYAWLLGQGEKPDFVRVD